MDPTEAKDGDRRKRPRPDQAPGPVLAPMGIDDEDAVKSEGGGDVAPPLGPPPDPPPIRGVREIALEILDAFLRQEANVFPADPFKDETGANALLEFLKLWARFTLTASGPRAADDANSALAASLVRSAAATCRDEQKGPIKIALLRCIETRCHLQIARIANHPLRTRFSEDDAVVSRRDWLSLEEVRVLIRKSITVRTGAITDIDGQISECDDFLKEMDETKGYQFPADLRTEVLENKSKLKNSRGDIEVDVELLTGITKGLLDTVPYAASISVPCEFLDHFARDTATWSREWKPLFEELKRKCVAHWTGAGELENRLLAVSLESANAKSQSARALEEVWRLPFFKDGISGKWTAVFNKLSDKIRGHEFLILETANCKVATWRMVAEIAAKKAEECDREVSAARDRILARTTILAKLGSEISALDREMARAPDALGNIHLAELWIAQKLLVLYNADAIFGKSIKSNIDTAARLRQVENSARGRMSAAEVDFSHLHISYDKDNNFNRKQHEDALNVNTPLLFLSGAATSPQMLKENFMARALDASDANALVDHHTSYLGGFKRHAILDPETVGILLGRFDTLKVGQPPASVSDDHIAIVCRGRTEAPVESWRSATAAEIIDGLRISEAAAGALVARLRAIASYGFVPGRVLALAGGYALPRLYLFEIARGGGGEGAIPSASDLHQSAVTSQGLDVPANIEAVIDLGMSDGNGARETLSIAQRKKETTEKIMAVLTAFQTKLGAEIERRASSREKISKHIEFVRKQIDRRREADGEFTRVDAEHTQAKSTLVRIRENVKRACAELSAVVLFPGAAATNVRILEGVVDRLIHLLDNTNVTANGTLSPTIASGLRAAETATKRLLTPARMRILGRAENNALRNDIDVHVARLEERDRGHRLIVTSISAEHNNSRGCVASLRAELSKCRDDIENVRKALGSLGKKFRWDDEEKKTMDTLKACKAYPEEATRAETAWEEAITRADSDVTELIRDGWYDSPDESAPIRGIRDTIVQSATKDEGIAAPIIRRFATESNSGRFFWSMSVPHALKQVRREEETTLLADARGINDEYGNDEKIRSAFLVTQLGQDIEREGSVCVVEIGSDADYTAGYNEQIVVPYARVIESILGRCRCNTVDWLDALKSPNPTVAKDLQDTAAALERRVVEAETKADEEERRANDNKKDVDENQAAVNRAHEKAERADHNQRRVLASWTEVSTTIGCTEPEALRAARRLFESALLELGEDRVSLARASSGLSSATGKLDGIDSDSIVAILDRGRSLETKLTSTETTLRSWLLTETQNSAVLEAASKQRDAATEALRLANAELRSAENALKKSKSAGVSDVAMNTEDKEADGDAKDQVEYDADVNVAGRTAVSAEVERYMAETKRKVDALKDALRSEVAAYLRKAAQAVDKLTPRKGEVDAKSQRTRELVPVAPIAAVATAVAGRAGGAIAPIQLQPVAAVAPSSKQRGGGGAVVAQVRQENTAINFVSFRVAAAVLGALGLAPRRAVCAQLKQIS